MAPVISDGQSELNLRRVVSLDALRGLGVVLMILWHFLTWTSREIPGFLDMGGMSFGWPLAATIFFTVSGASLYLASSRRIRLGQSWAKVRGHVLARYGLLILLGLALNVLLAGLRRIWRWDVLESIGAGNLLAYLLLERGVGPAGVAGASALVFAFSALKPGLSGLPAPVRNALFTGMFPLFPWLSLVIGGIMLGRFAAAGAGHRPILAPAMVAMPMIVSGIALAVADPLKDRLLFHIMISTGIALIAFSLFLFLEGRAAWIPAAFAVPGRVALGIYVWHLLVVCMAVRFFHLERALAFPDSFAFSLVATVLFILASAVWLKIRERTVSSAVRLLRSR